MKLKKLAIVFLFITSTSAFSQKWVNNQVATEIAKTNKQLAATDQALVLTTEQKEKVSEIYKNFVLQKTEKSKTIKDKKELWKALKPELNERNQKVKELLSEEQNKAIRNYWRNKNKK